MDNECVVCGEVIPEGRQVCLRCEEDRKARFDYAMGVKAKTVKSVGKWIGIAPAVLIIVISFIIGWLTTCGIIKAITLCFGWEFSLPWVTGFWLFLTVFAGILGLVGNRK